MNRRTLAIGLAILTVSMQARAQRPGSQPPRQGRPGSGPAAPSGFHLLPALDANGDGKVSAKELANAVTALKKLDKNKDGKLSAQEIGWPPTGGFPGGRGRGGTRGRGPDRGGPGGGFGGFRGGFGGRTAKPRRPDPEEKARQYRQFFRIETMRQLDRNKDGKIVTSEVPKGLRKLIFRRLDLDKNGTIDKSELDELAKGQKK